MEGGQQVQAGAARAAGLGGALVVVGLTAGARVARGTEAVEGAGGVEAGAAVLTGAGTLLGHLALVQVLVAGGPRVARLAQAQGGARQGVGAAPGFTVARLAQTQVLQVAQEACAPGRAEAGKGAHAVKAGGSWGTGGMSTVIQVLLTARATPAANAHAVKAAG